MNAYELAEIVDKWAYSESAEYLTDAANMLRQQADRIAELENQGEPVAWMQMHYKDNVPTKFSPVKVWEDDIPLYTTPQTKPLSDEEIMDIAEQSDYSPVEIEMGYDYEIRIARAIEERHGIK